MRWIDNFVIYKNEIDYRLNFPELNISPRKGRVPAWREVRPAVAKRIRRTTVKRY